MRTNEQYGRAARPGEDATRPIGWMRRLFEPRAVAFVGVSDRLETYGGRAFRYCLEGGYEGAVYPVHPRYEAVQGRRCYPDLDSIPGPLDVVVALVGPQRLPELYAAAARRGVAFLVVVGELLAGTEAERHAAAQTFRAGVAAGGPRIVGPVCVGVLAPPIGLSLSISSALPLGLPASGGIGLVSQSGGLIGSIVDRSRQSGAGFSGLVSSGGEFDLTTCDYLEHFVEDPGTRVVALYAEGLDDSERFFALAQRAQAAGKPVLLLKAGRTAAGAAAALSHSGRMASDDDVLTAACRRHGVLLVEDLDDLHVTAEALARCQVRTGTGVAGLSLSGGYSVVMGDALARAGLPVATLGAESERLIAAELGLRRVANPVDAGQNSVPGEENEDLRRTLRALDADPAVGLLLYGETTHLMQHETAAALAKLSRSLSKPLMVCWQAGPTIDGAVAELRAAGVATLTDLRQTVAAIGALYRQAAWQSPNSAEGLRQGASLAAEPWTELQALLRAAPAGLLPEEASGSLLMAAGVPLVSERLLAVGEDPAAAIESLGFPLVLKGIVHGLAHKTEAGLVKVGLADRNALKAAMREMQQAPASLIGFQLQPTVAGGIEMIVGVKNDPGLGPAVLLGFGGIFAEAMPRRAIEMAPLDAATAERMIEQVDGGGILAGYRTGRPLQREALRDLLVAVGVFAWTARARLLSLDLNPVIVTANSALAVDRVVELS